MGKRDRDMDWQGESHTPVAVNHNKTGYQRYGTFPEA